MVGRTISIANRHTRLKLDRQRLVRAIERLDAAASDFHGGAPAGELSLVFLTDAALARLHADFLADPSITDVITFMGEPGLGSAGEICVSVDAALRHAGAGATVGALAEELTLYIVHGWLHLAGYDDLEPPKKREMRRAEARALKILHGADCIPRFRLSQ